MKRLYGFPPVADEHATVLILGSMPGRRSLQMRQYYAHPHNAFWRIMSALTGAAPEQPYAQRLAALQAACIALWDVLHSCEREGSLDHRIAREQANDFATFCARHPRITRVFFNGSKAEQSFRKFVLGRQMLPPLSLQRLPSTSPAYAGKSYEEKLEVWRAAIQPYLPAHPVLPG